MPKEIRITFDDNTFEDFMECARHRFGQNAKPQEYIKTSFVSLTRRDRAAREKKTK